MPAEHGCLIIGAGHAADEVAIALRGFGYQAPITIIGEEAHPPYQRPPLSKTFLAGAHAAASLYFRDPAVYAKERIEVLTGRTVTSIDPTGRTVTLDRDEVRRYGTLVIATGARPRWPAVPGSDLPGLYPVRAIADIEAIRPNVVPGVPIVLVGAGYIGLETAAMLQKLGAKVTVLEAMPRVLQRVTAPAVSAFFERMHREEGVEIRTGVTVERFAQTTDGLMVHVAGAPAIPAKIVIIGIGVLPNMEMAAAAGLKTGNGIQVDAYCQTSDENIYAVGDVAHFESPHYRTSMRLESVQNAKDMGRVAAAAIAGKPVPYDALPWFWSDQYDVKLQIAGVSTGYDTVALRGDPSAGRSFAAFYLKAGEIIAVDAVNRPKEFMLGKKLITARKRLSAEVIGDETFPVMELLGK